MNALELVDGRCEAWKLVPPLVEPCGHLKCFTFFAHQIDRTAPQPCQVRQGRSCGQVGLHRLSYGRVILTSVRQRTNLAGDAAGRLDCQAHARRAAALTTNGCPRSARSPRVLGTGAPSLCGMGREEFSAMAPTQARCTTWRRECRTFPHFTLLTAIRLPLSLS